DCVVEVLPNLPRSGYVEVGELSMEAYAAGPSRYQYRDPHVLAAELHGQICATGGDTLVAERNAAGVIVRGTVLRRIHMNDVMPEPARLPPPAEACEPSCHAGFACEGGTCVE